MTFVIYDKDADVQHNLQVKGVDASQRIKQRLIASTNIEDYQTTQLYIHVPFCFFHCSFCVYRGELLKNRGQIKSYIDACRREMDELAHLLPDLRLDAAFVGGGTVTVLDNQELDQMLRLTRSSFSLDSESGEFTVELAPHGLSAKKLDTLSRHGVNRVTIGVQSLDEGLLKLMNRPPKSKNSINRLIQIAKSIGFRDVNVDLMVGIRGRTYENFKNDFLQFADWGCHSIMVYIDMHVYRDQAKLVQLRKASEMVSRLAEEVSDRFVLNNSEGVNEYNRFIAVGATGSSDFKVRYSTDYRDPDTFCIGVGTGAKSWNRELVFYST